MTYYGGKELAASFRTVRANTVKIAQDIPEDKYGFQAAPDTKPVGKLLTHIAVVTSFASHVHGNKIADIAKVDFAALMGKVAAEEAKPRTKAEIIEFLKTEG